MTPEAVGELYEAERATLTRSVERLVGDRHAAEDLVHDSFVAYLASSPGADRPGAWLSRVARNRALNHLRRPAPLPLVEDAASESDASASGPEREAVAAVVARALGALHDRDRLALQLRFFEGLDYAQIAARLGARVEQTHVIVHRATRRLGREVIRRLAQVHGASACEDALAGMAGLTSLVSEHGEGPCERCRPAWDEIGALRALPGLAPIAAGPGMLRRMFGRIWTRAAGLADLSSNVAGAIVGVAVVVSSAAPGGAVPAARSTTARPNVRSVVPANVKAPAPIAPVQKVKAPVTTSSKSAPLNSGGENTNVGGVNLTDRGDHTQVEPETPQGSDSGGSGVVVCEPLQPCPPPPSPEPAP
jgi:RNA polymerase sigma factor (sigma-70 family)